MIKINTLPSTLDCRFHAQSECKGMKKFSKILHRNNIFDSDDIRETQFSGIFPPRQVLRETVEAELQKEVRPNHLPTRASVRTQLT